MNAPINFSYEKPTERQARSAHVIKAIDAAEAGVNLTPRRRRYEKIDEQQSEIIAQDAEKTIESEDTSKDEAEFTSLLMERSGRKKIYYPKRIDKGDGAISTTDVHPDDILEIAFKVNGEK